MNESPKLRLSYKAAVRLLDGQRKLLREVSADDEVMSAYEAIIRHLNRMTPEQIDRLFGHSTAISNRIKAEEAEKKASQMSLEDVEAVLERESTSRLDLEAIAIGRFHVPRGSMRSLGNLDNLREKIDTLVRNEKTHSTITQMAFESRRRPY